MKQNLDSLKDEILQALESEGVVVFRGTRRTPEGVSRVWWDTRQFPDYHAFLAAARQVGVKLIVFHSREFTADQLEEVRESLEEAELPVEDQQSLRRRLKALDHYTGFTCAIELSFDYQGSVYACEFRAAWYEEFLEIADEVDLMSPGYDEYDEDDESGGQMGYFSRN